MKKKLLIITLLFSTTFCYSQTEQETVDFLNSLFRTHSNGSMLTSFKVVKNNEQNLLQILNTVSFVNKIIFGRTNYNKEITAFTAHKAFYNQQVDIVIDFCERNGVNYHIKDGTMT